jgi:hypothetical protein
VTACCTQSQHDGGRRVPATPLALHRRDKTGLPAAQRTSRPDGAQHMTGNSACTAYPRTTEGERYAGATPHRPGPARSIHPRRQRDSARDSGGNSSTGWKPPTPKSSSSAAPTASSSPPHKREPTRSETSSTSWTSSHIRLARPPRPRCRIGGDERGDGNAEPVLKPEKPNRHTSGNPLQVPT